MGAIESSGFLLTPHDSFHTLQDGWKKEIAEVLEELKLKESVSFVNLFRKLKIIDSFFVQLTKAFKSYEEVNGCEKQIYSCLNFK